MYQMLTNELPIQGDTSLQIVMAHIQTPPIRIQCAQAGVKIPQPLGDLVMKCLEKNREDRPANGQAIIDALDRWELERRGNEEGETLLVAPGGTAPRPAAARSIVQVATGSASANRAGTSGVAPAGQQVASRTTRSWIPLAAMVIVAPIGVAGAWRYRSALFRAVARSADSGDSSSGPQPKTETPSPAHQPDTLPGAPTEKPVAPAAASENLSAENAATPPASPSAKPVPPPDPSKTKYYADTAGRKVSYAAGTAGEHNEFKAVQAEKDEAHQIQRLDDFVSRFPNSGLLVDAYALYYRDYRELKNFPKVIEYSDKLVALGDKADANARFQTLYARAIAYDALRPDDSAQAKQAKDAAALGLSTLNEIKKPETSRKQRLPRSESQSWSTWMRPRERPP
jgi:hypothetical protein